MSDQHNAITARFVNEYLRSMDSMTHAESMTVFESLILAMMMFNSKRHGVIPSHSVELMETALHAATERFSRAQAAMR